MLFNVSSSYFKFCIIIAYLQMKENTLFLPFIIGDIQSFIKRINKRYNHKIPRTNKILETKIVLVLMDLP